MNKQTSNFLIVSALAVGGYFLYKSKWKAKAEADPTEGELSQEGAQSIADQIAMSQVGVYHKPSKEDIAENAELRRKLDNGGYVYRQGSYGQGFAVKKGQEKLFEASRLAKQVAQWRGRLVKNPNEAKSTRDHWEKTIHKWNIELANMGYKEIDGLPVPVSQETDLKK